MSNIKDMDSLSEIIKDELNKYESNIDTTSIGQVVSVGDCIATIYGIEDAMYGELISFNILLYSFLLIQILLH